MGIDNLKKSPAPVVRVKVKEKYDIVIIKIKFLINFLSLQLKRKYNKIVKPNKEIVSPIDKKRFSCELLFSAIFREPL